MKSLTEKEIKIAVKYDINPLRAVVAKSNIGLFVIEESDYSPNPNLVTPPEENQDDIKGINAFRLINKNGQIYEENLAFIGYTILHHDNGEISLQVETTCFPVKYTREFGLCMDFLYNRAIELKAKTVKNRVVNVPDKIVRDLKETQFSATFEALDKSLETPPSSTERF